MVVVVPTAGLTRPPLFGALFHEGEIVAELLVAEYSWWTLGSTCVHEVKVAARKQLEGRWFSSFGKAAQAVSEAISGASTEYMRTVALRVVAAQSTHGRPVPTIILQDSVRTKKPGAALEAIDHAHIQTRVHSIPLAAPREYGVWLPIGKGRPYIPHTLPSAQAANPTLWASMPASANDTSRGSSDPSTQGDQGSAHGKKRVLDPDREHRRSKKKQRMKVPTQPGMLVFDRMAAANMLPRAFIIKEVVEDKGDVRRQCSTSLYLERFESHPPQGELECIWRLTTEVDNFDERLRKIYSEEREQLEQCGAWTEVEAVAKRALLHRHAMAPHLSLEQLWHGRMGMPSSAPCPVPEHEAAGYG